MHFHVVHKYLCHSICHIAWNKALLVPFLNVIRDASTTASLYWW
jgi:hypothetical protein